MEEIVLVTDDPRLGAFNPDGSYAKWPAQDALGKPYDRKDATVHRVDESHFIVVGPDVESRIASISLGGKTLPTVKAPAEPASDPKQKST